MNNELISQQFIVIIIVSATAGTLARIFTLILDYRQYPNYPNGYLTHLVTGFIASALGAIAVPAIMTKDFEAVTFLALAIEQFREVRRIENESLQALEDSDRVPRGIAYIDGIAKTFEARNYISLLVAFVTGLTMEIVPEGALLLSSACGLTSAVIVFYLLNRFSKGKTVGDIADVKLGKIRVENSELYVDDIFVTNHLGTDIARELVQKEGLAAVVYPHADGFRLTLDHSGQRQAMLFEACRILGLKRYNFTRKDFISGRIAIAFVPIIRDEKILLDVIRKTPLLESVRKNSKLAQTDYMNK